MCTLTTRRVQLTPFRLLAVDFTDKHFFKSLFYNRLKTWEMEPCMMPKHLLRKTAILVHVINLETIYYLLWECSLRLSNQHKKSGTRTRKTYFPQCTSKGDLMYRSAAQLFDQPLRGDADLIPTPSRYGIWSPATLEARISLQFEGGESSDLCICPIVNSLTCITITDTGKPVPDNRRWSGDFDVLLEPY
jgi:hypothetical protein